MNITGVYEIIDRSLHECPNDGVHVAGKDGFIKGVRNVKINGQIIPKGMVGFYYQIDKNIGIKVFMFLPKSDKKMWLSKENYVIKVFKQMKKLYKAGLSPMPYRVEKVYINLTSTLGAINATAYGIVQQHVHYPVRAWENYGEGKPYDWKSVDQEKHTPQEFIRFVEFAKKKLRKMNIKIDSSFKLGDVVYCTKTKRWWLVDCD